METKDTLNKKIESLPKGYVTKKKINGKIYYYHQWKEGNKTKSYTIHEDEVPYLKEKIEERKQLKKELKSLEQIPVGNENTIETDLNALTGNALKNMIHMADGMEARDCFSKLEQYVFEKSIDKVCLLYGLRRTGKTMMIRQVISKMTNEQFEKTVYIKASQKDTMASLNKDLKKYVGNGYQYIFIDEVTLISDFIDGASLFSDVYAAQGIKVILSGTDSLGFYFASNEELYDRTVLIHTTFISYKEHSRLLKIQNIDEYIRYGGTLKAGELDFEREDASFKDDESTRRYIDTAICKNIQHSLKCYEEGSHFRHLKALYNVDELTNAINRIIQDINHDFTIQVITKDFVSRDLKSSAQMLRKAKKEENRSTVLDEIDTEDVIYRLMKILDIYNQSDLKEEITESVVYEIKEYLQALDLIENVTIRSSIMNEDDLEHIIFTQPGMRYCQAQALVYSLMQNREFNELSEREKNLISTKILEDVKGIMLEDIVLLETKKYIEPYKSVFKLLFAYGEFDMVIYDSKMDSCEIYEIKHSNQQVDLQWKNIMDENKIQFTQKKYGKITKRCVLYTGKSCILEDGREYKNVEEYLKELY